MSVPLLDLVAQYQTIKDVVLPALQSVIERQQFIMGPEVGELECAVAGLLGVRQAVACASGTDALLLPLQAMRLQPGDEVITPSFTFFATAGAVHNAGGTPVFVDIDPSTFLLDPAAVEAAITPRTRAIVVVHLYGQMVAMESMLALAGRRGIAVIEDAAQAIGARQRIGGEWRSAGSLGFAGALSFFPSKNLGGYGDGGMMVPQDERLYRRLLRLRTHGGLEIAHARQLRFRQRGQRPYVILAPGAGADHADSHPRHAGSVTRRTPGPPRSQRPAERRSARDRWGATARKPWRLP